MERGHEAEQGGFGAVYVKVVNTVLVMLLAGLCLVVGMAPLFAVAFGVGDLSYWPGYIIAAALSAPGLAAEFAVFRDHPTLFSANALSRRIGIGRNGETSYRPEGIADPYVRVDSSVAFARPFLRAYARLFPRALAMGAMFMALVFCFVYDLLLFMQTAWGVAVVPLMVVCMVVAIQSMLISLVLVVECPNANVLTLARNAVLLSVRRIPIVIVSIVAIGGYLWGLASAGLLVLVFATGVVAYVVWASARWQADVLLGRLAEARID
ncbi:hypothetical protein [Bifidobacterium eulemuris]|uniref:DUF624 domain-containing protein n=1 Tax=Bifidobacterium eulemuris TaxID=1765219 RepID=A0A7L9SRH8_9BIFI|nr:hypothetical protein [Bifidobacterium eulemuris]QOL32815.1 hypothetical protein BE0216_10505 [Bifidobacterium eulemuris]